MESTGDPTRVMIIIELDDAMKATWLENHCRIGEKIQRFSTAIMARLKLMAPLPISLSIAVMVFVIEPSLAFVLSSRPPPSLQLLAAKQLQNWKILSSGRVKGESGGSILSTSRLKNPEKAAKDAVVRTESGSSYRLVGDPLPGSKVFQARTKEELSDPAEENTSSSNSRITRSNSKNDDGGSALVSAES